MTSSTPKKKSQLQVTPNDNWPAEEIAGCAVFNEDILIGFTTMAPAMRLLAIAASAALLSFAEYARLRSIIKNTNLSDAEAERAVIKVLGQRTKELVNNVIAVVDRGGDVNSLIADARTRPSMVATSAELEDIVMGRSSNKAILLVPPSTDAFGLLSKDAMLPN